MKENEKKAKKSIIRQTFKNLFGNTTSDYEFNEEERPGEKDFAKALLLHIDNLLHMRLRLFLIMEGILFAAIIATLKNELYPYVGLLITLAGLIFTFIFGYALRRLNRGLSWLAKQCEKVETHTKSIGNMVVRTYQQIG